MKVNHFELEEIDRIRKHLQNNPKHLLLFNLGINTGLRMSDLLSLKISHFINRKIGDTIEIVEKKTNKINYIVFNKIIYKSFQSYLKSLETYNENDFLFKSRKGTNNPYTIQHSHFLIKSICKTLGFPGNYGTHSLRKTFGYVHRKYNGVGIEVLMKRFSHSNQSITLRYIGLTEKEVEGVLMTSI